MKKLGAILSVLFLFVFVGFLNAQGSNPKVEEWDSDWSQAVRSAVDTMTGDASYKQKLCVASNRISNDIWAYLKRSARRKKSEELWGELFKFDERGNDSRSEIEHARAYLRIHPDGEHVAAAHLQLGMNAVQDAKDLYALRGDRAQRIVATEIERFDLVCPEDYLEQGLLRVEVASIALSWGEVELAKKLLDQAIALPMGAEELRLRFKNGNYSQHDWWRSARRRCDLYGETFDEYGGTDLEGKKVQILDYRGKVLLVEFWASESHGSIRGQLPDTRALHERYHRRGLEVLGVSLDPDKRQAREAVKAFNLPGAHLLNGVNIRFGLLTKPFMVESVPYSVLFGRGGKVRAVGLMGMQLEEAVQKLIKEKAPKLKRKR